MSESPDQHSIATVIRFSSALATLALAIFLGNVVLVAFDVVMRGVFRVPQSWVADIGQLSYPVALACCFPVALETGHMITVRALAGRIGPRATLALDLGGQLCMALLLSLFAWQMFARAFTDWTTGFENFGDRAAGRTNVADRSRRVVHFRTDPVPPNVAALDAILTSSRS